MVKRISLVARREGLTFEQFKEHWLGPHVEIVRQLRHLRGLRLNPVLEAATDREWDGIGELWFDSIDDVKAAFAAEPVRTLLADDRPKFLGRNQAYFVVEHTVIEPPPLD